MTTIAGIDPGFTGAIAFLSDSSLSVYDLPIKKIMNKKQVCGKQLTKLFKKHAVDICVIEDVHSMPDQGVASTFTFGYNAGILLGVAEALGIKVLKVKPAAWKSALNLSKDKKKSLALAIKLFPEYKDLFKRAKDDGRAEAALLAYLIKKQLY